MNIQTPLNKVQEAFNDLCNRGGGIAGGPSPALVRRLLHDGSLNLNAYAQGAVNEHLAEFADRNPWHVCFAIGLGWGHLAKIALEFTDAAILALASLDSAAIDQASRFHLERGPDPIRQSLVGGYQMFQMVNLPTSIPSTVREFSRAQERWITPLVSPGIQRPPYIGTWNATAMFMMALFSQEKVADDPAVAGAVQLPPNGPIAAALNILHRANILSRAAAGNDLDEGEWDPAVIYENNSLMRELIDQELGLNILGVHSGLYMIGTRDKNSKGWV